MTSIESAAQRDGTTDNLFSADHSIISKKTSLTLPSDLPIDTWQHIGEHISQISNASAWWLGDWLVFGLNKYPDRYKRAMSDTSLDYGTLRNYAWIARRFAPERRRESLSFQHHVEVAALPAEEQNHWLDFAEKLGWSRNELRKQLRAGYEDDRPALDKNDEINLRLRVAKDQIERWEKAAQQVGANLVDWISSTLEKATRNDAVGGRPFQEKEVSLGSGVSPSGHRAGAVESASPGERPHRLFLGISGSPPCPATVARTGRDLCVPGPAVSCRLDIAARKECARDVGRRTHPVPCHAMPCRAVPRRERSALVVQLLDGELVPYTAAACWARDFTRV